MKLHNLQFAEAEKKVDSFCEHRVPDSVKHKVNLSYERRGKTITLFENRAPWKEGLNWSKLAVAKFRYNESNFTWTLYCADRNERWFNYVDISPSNDLNDLLAEVDKDPTGIFWG